MSSLPADCQQHYQQQTSQPPLVLARALTDLGGNLGETHLACDGQLLLLYSRRAGQALEPHQYRLSELRAAELSEDRPFARLALSLPSGEYLLKFALPEKATLERLLALWRASQGAAPSLAGTTPATSPASGPPPLPLPATLNPLLAFSACLHCLVAVDGGIDAEEQHLANRIIGDPALANQASAWLKQHGQAALLAALPGLLNRDQALCLLANLLDIAMVDGLLRSRERALLEDTQRALAINDHDYQALYDILLIKHNLSVFTRT